MLGGHASGEPGGVGQGAAGYDTERDESLNPAALEPYLENLRADVAGRDGGPRPGTDDGAPRPRPDGDVVEQSSTDGDSQRWTVTLQWDAADDASNAADSETEPTADASSDD